MQDPPMNSLFTLFVAIAATLLVASGFAALHGQYQQYATRQAIADIRIAPMEFVHARQPATSQPAAKALRMTEQQVPAPVKRLSF